MTLDDLQQIKDSLDKGVIVSKPSWLEVLDWAIELTKYHETGTDSDWQSWSGGECPVDPSVTVEFVCGDGYSNRTQAMNLIWENYGTGADIVRYKVAP